MENLIVCCLLYIVLVAIAHQPRHTESEPIDYFPNLEEPTDPAIADPQPKIISEALPVAKFKAPKPKAQPTQTTPKTDEKPLSDLSIRQLKALAKERTGTPRAIKKYSLLTRAELIAALSR